MDRSPRYIVAAMYAMGALTPLLVFVVPFFVPTAPAQTISSSYLAGFNNGTAIASAVLLSVAVLVLSWWSHRGRAQGLPDESAFSRLPARLVVAVLGVTALVQAFAGCLITSSHQRNLADAGYFIEQATVRADTGRALYTQIEFAYGPLLLLPEVWLSRLLQCSITDAYFVCLVIESALGLLMLAFLLNHLPIRAELRKAAFVLLAIAAVTPHFGLNYTLFRFASPLAVLLFATRVRSPWRCMLLLAAGEALELLISPELGLALCVGVLTYGLVRMYQDGWRWLPVALVPTAVLAGLLMTLGRPYLRMAAMFSRGALNLPVGPYPHILLLLFALVWLVPMTLGRFIDLSDERGACLLALYAVSIAFMPAALGRCDPLHVMFNGTGILVLSLLAFNGSSVGARNAWIACIAFVVLWDHRVNDRLFKYQDGIMVREAVLPHVPPKVQDGLVRVTAHENPYLAYVLSRQADPERPVNLAELMKLVGNAPVATPAEISPAVESQLRTAHLYDPGYFAFWMDTMNPQSEQRIVDYANAHQWMLLPSWWSGGNLQLPKDSGLFQGLNLHYKQRKPVLYDPGALFNENLEDNWTVAWSFGSYILYKHTSAPGPETKSSESRP